jgi:GAF domain
LALVSQLGGVPTAPLESVTFNEELATRPCWPPDYAAEVRALSTLIRKLADSPETILQGLVDEMLDLFKAHSAGISLLTTIDGEARFCWPAIAGAWKCFIGGGTPRNFGPCGDVIDRNCSFLFRDLERRYGYYETAKPRVEECLLSPFYLEGMPAGTLWIVAHNKTRQFDAEDLRPLENIGRFAATAYRTGNVLGDLQQKSERLEATETMLRHQVSALEAAQVRLADANTDLHHFAFAASHDLREPLRMVNSYSQLL